MLCIKYSKEETEVDREVHESKKIGQKKFTKRGGRNQL